MAQAKGKVVDGSPKYWILVLMEGHPIGLHTSALASKIGATTQRTVECCTDLQRAGLLARVPDGGQQCTRRVRWCLPQHVEECKADVKAERVKAAPSSGGMKSVGPDIGGWKSKKSKHKAQPTGSTPIAYVSSELHTVPRVEQHFSRKTADGHMAPLASTGSAIERAYS